MTRAEMEAAIGPDTLATLTGYIEHGAHPGGFLEAVLSNDLRAACERADAANRHKLFSIVSWLSNYAPWRCWGNLDSIDRWMESRRVGERRAQRYVAASILNSRRQFGEE